MLVALVKTLVAVPSTVVPSERMVKTSVVGMVVKLVVGKAATRSPDPV